MAALCARTCETAKPDKTGRDRLLGDGDGLFLRIRPHGTKTWLIEFEFEGVRRKYTIGIYDAAGSPAESITKWLEHGRLWLSQARSIAGQWKAERRAGRDPVAEWEKNLGKKRAAVEAKRKAEVTEAQRPTVINVIEQFMAKHINGKKSAAHIRYRLDRGRFGQTGRDQ